MHLSVGEKLGPYEILALIGKGGMGEVYRARDTKLDRDVAIKVLPAALARDPERLARFEREAKVLAQLNHPNIATIYAIEESPEGKAIAMELVPGSTLKRPLPLDTALNYARQIAEALEAAHEKGITHRDLKPGNIMITPDGVVKVLDFGLAAFPGPDRDAAGNLSDSPTLTISPTRAGMILGTAAYMSPEQAAGKPVDKRADIWSFGVVLYEMVTGEQLFRGETVSHILASVFKDEPDLTKVPAKVRRLLRRCLEKDPKKRLRDIGDAMELVEEGPAQTFAPSSPRFGYAGWITAGVLALASGVVYYRTTRPAALKPLVRLDVDLGEDVSLSPPTVGQSNIAISTDGTRLAYTSGSPAKLFTRRLDQPQATELPGTEGAFGPFFSPDGRWIGFSIGPKLNKISMEGGAILPLGDFANYAGASWGQDGKIVVSNALSKGLMRIPAEGGTPETLADLGKGEIALGRPQILPGGKAVLFSTLTALNSENTTIEVLTLADRRRKVVSRGGSYGRYLPTSERDGHLMYLNSGTLFAIPFDLDKLETHGAAVPVVDGVAYEAGSRTAQVDFSLTGTFVYRKGSGTSSLRTTLQWVDPAGKGDPLRAKPRTYLNPNVSPDGKRVALIDFEGADADVWTYNPERETMTRLSFGGGPYLHPLWSPDGQYVVFGSISNSLFWTRADGASQPRVLTQVSIALTPTSFTPDGKWLAFSDGIARRQIWTVALENQGGQWKAGKPTPFLQDNFDDLSPAFSPDGRWLAYQSTESGRPEVYVRAFPPSAQGGKWQISNNGGVAPHWSRSGHEIVYQSGDQILTASYTVNGDSFVAEKPRVWIAKLGGTEWDLAPDGKRVLVLSPVGNAGVPKQEHEVVLLENFFDELRRRAPTGK